MWRGFLIALPLAVAVGVLALALRWQMAYGEAETRSSLAQDFGKRLAQRLTEGGRREVELADIKALLADDHFSRLRDRGFVPSFTPGTLVTLRINDSYEFPIAADGSISWTKRE